MILSPDALVYWQWGPLKLTATLVFSWLVILLLALSSWLITRKLSSTRPKRAQTVLETIVDFLQRQIEEVSHQEAQPYLPFIGTLFLFIASSNLLAIVPGFQAPTGSLTTTAALAVCVFFAVPMFGISKRGVGAYFKQYIQPSFLMLPFNLIGELSRTLSLAMRLFGNIMSGSVIVAILLSIAPLFFPIIMQAFGLLIGLIQAYIFAILALVFIVSGTTAQKSAEPSAQRK